MPQSCSTIKAVIGIGFASTLLAIQGCTALDPIGYEVHTPGGDLNFVKTGCQVAGATYTDTSGQGYRGGLFRMVSVDANGNTMDEYYITCKPTGPNRTSNCSVTVVGSTTTYMSYGGPACPNLQKFVFVQ